MPATTGVSAVPSSRPAGEVSGALVPVFRLTDAADGDDRNKKSSPQLAALFDPARLLGLPGLVIGGRVWGKDGDTGVEPMLGYRHAIDDHFSIAGVGYGTHMRADSNGAHYEASRFGAEAIADLRILDLTSWLSAHAQAAAQATYVKASGHYCVDVASGDGHDCAEDGSFPYTYGTLSGVFPAGTLTVALDAHIKDSWFHHARLAGMFSTGWMPRVVNGEQRAGDAYVTGGLSLMIAFGAPGE